MRQALALLFVVSCVPVCAQDVSQQIAIQQATQASIQASQQATADAQRASQQAQQDAQNATNDGFLSTVPMASRPKFSVASGSYSAPQTVRITASNRQASIFYTTDGWTPTIDSPRYDGPITISSTTHLRAIAIAPNRSRSPVSEADYTLAGSTADVPAEVELAADGVLRQGTTVPLAFVSAVSSNTARVGDPITLALRSDMVANGVVVLPKMTQASGRIVAVKRSAMAGQPGAITFEIRSLQAKGVTVPLTGTLTEEGKDKYSKAKSLVMIPAVNMSVMAIRGEQAEIKADTPVTALVAADTKLAR
jgi:hypothetical protein